MIHYNVVQSICYLLLGCHSAKHMRYLRIALDVGVDQKKMLKDIAPEGQASMTNSTVLWTSMMRKNGLVRNRPTCR